VTILKHLRAAAAPDTVLVVVDHVLSYACPIDPSGAAELVDVPGAVLPHVPPPLLANMGRGGARVYLGDYQMMVFNNGQERTIGEFATLGRDSGWKMTAVNVGGNGTFAYVIYVPV
jgi:hypothetical protein